MKSFRWALRLALADYKDFDNWVMPSDAQIKEEWDEIDSETNVLRDEIIRKEDLVDPTKHEVSAESFLGTVKRGKVLTLTPEEAGQLALESGAGRLPKKEWLLDKAKGPEGDWQPSSSHRYSERHHDSILPRLFNNEPIDMPIVFEDHSNGDLVFAISGRHRLSYCAVLGIPVKVVAITEWQMVKDSGLIKPEAFVREYGE
jgi:hypothetical protein